MIGQIISSYHIYDKLGAGGMGNVWLARDDRLQREVALKTLPPEFVADPAAVSRFREEALALASLNHPNIATIYGLEETPDKSMILVLERVEGETLAERLRRSGLASREALQVCVQIAQALEAAHERGIVHRDLKP